MTTEAGKELDRKLRKVRPLNATRTYRNNHERKVDIHAPRGQRLILTVKESVELREALLEAELKILGGR